VRRNAVALLLRLYEICCDFRGYRLDARRTSLEAQHGRDPFELAVVVDLVASEPLHLVGVQRLGESLLADQRAVCQFVPAGLELRSRRLRRIPLGRRHARNGSAVTAA
jgi:hypothetical protein